ncbi:MAG: NAD(P)/FAD-dependent oxidoreductase [Nitrospiraceae bacterium]|nr:NAD(P)/FAD-dependent oxidoreductase [Nitrospiraceae bacterium]
MQTRPIPSYDAAIIGMGPGGAVAAAELSQAGLRVIAFDKEVHPRYKVCGGGLSARITQVLHLELDSLVERSIYGVRFTYKGQRSHLIESSSPIAYMVMRDRLDHHLGERARQSGTDIHQGEAVVGLAQDEDGVDIVTARSRYRAAVVIGADGANSLVARQLFPGRSVHRVPALESEVPVEDDCEIPGARSILVDIGAASQGYGWIFPKQGRLSVGLGEFRLKSSRLRASFENFVREQEGLAQREVPRPIGHPIPVFSREGNGERGQAGSLVNGRVLLVGDAGHLVDPLFGEGIYYAVRSGQLAARAILRTAKEPGRSLQEYEKDVEREIVPEFRVTARIARVVYGFPYLCFKLLRKYEPIVQGYFGVLQGRTTAERFLGEAKAKVKASVGELLLEAVRLR